MSGHYALTRSQLCLNIPTAVPEYPNIAKAQVKDLKTNYMKILKIFKEEMNKFLKEIEENTNQQLKEINSH